jgi:hypothetical protein
LKDVSAVSFHGYEVSKELSGTVLSYRLDDRVFESWRGLGISLFITAFTQPPMKWVQEALSLGLKLLGREADSSPPSSAKVKNAWSIPPLPNTPWRGAQLKLTP